MSVRNPAPWILALTVAAAAGAFVIVHDAHPEDISGRKGGTAALIVIGVGVAVLAVVQRFWAAHMRRAAGLAALRAAREAAAAGTVTDPTRLEPNALLITMATAAVDEEAVLASGDAAWGIAERSQRSASWMMLLIVALMVPALALQDVRLIVFGSIPIVLYAVVLAVRVIRPGGTLAQGYAAADAQLAPLGLQASDRPDVVVVPRLAGEGLQSQVVGRTVLEGERHGRSVKVTIGGGRSETRVDAPTTPFTLSGYRQRVRADGAVPPGLEQVLEQLRASPRWTGMKLTAGPAGVVVVRKPSSSGEQRWLYDLWLAERVADVLAPTAGRA